MVLVIVAVKDRAADAFMRPFFVPTPAMAVRSFMDEVQRESADNQLFHHSDDFDLYEIGLFDDSTGRITSHDDMKVLMLGKQAKA
jgi:hypothetical protein